MAIQTKPTIKWVKSWDSPTIPSDLKIDPGTIAFYDPKFNTIYARRKFTPPTSVEHERYHALKRHPATRRDPHRYVRDELEAELHAQLTTGKKRRMFTTFNAILDDLRRLRYHIPLRQAFSILRQELYSLDPPLNWKRDYERLYERYSPKKK